MPCNANEGISDYEWMATIKTRPLVNVRVVEKRRRILTRMHVNTMRGWNEQFQEARVAVEGKHRCRVPMIDSSRWSASCDEEKR